MPPPFSDSGIYGLRPMTLDSLEKGDHSAVGWVREAVQEGDRFNRADPMYDAMELGMQYVVGEQRPTTIGGSGGPAYLPKLTLNESGKAMEMHVAALTDFQPVFGYKSMNPAFTTQASLINQLTIHWWITAMADIELGNCIKYALAAGTGDLMVEWDPDAGFHGDNTISARDPRDTLSWRPALHNKSIQDWEGVVVREAHSVNVMRGKFPDKANVFRPSTDSLLSTLMGWWRRQAARLVSPAADTLAGLDTPAAASQRRQGDVVLYRTWINDRTRNLTGKPIPMGTPGAAWAYVVKHGELLYPRKRMILCTPETLLYDGPNPYGHGMFPINRLKLQSVPWQFLGIPMLADLIPMQDGINHTIQAVLLGIDKWLNPAVKYNRGAVSESLMRLYDARRPGAKVKVNLDGMKEGFGHIEGPNAQVLKLALETTMFLLGRFDDRSGTPNLEQLLALRQLPSADTIQQMTQAMTPQIRQKGRQVEGFLRDVAEQLKVNRFQFESNAKRVVTLGDAGLTLQDFDFDPGTMVPAMQATDPDYQPEFDAALPFDQRAQAFHKTIVFTIAPNSILAMNAMEGKMMRLQLTRMGMCDVWTLAEALDIPNYGVPPAIPLPPLDPAAAQAEVAQLMQSGQIIPGPAGVTIGGKYVLDPMTGQLLEVRVPITVIERLQAQQLLGIGMTENPAGRKASGEAPPKLEQKSDGRQTVTESKKDPGPNSDNS